MAPRYVGRGRQTNDADDVATYAAFCRQYGDHYTPTAGGHCWNREATSQMVKHVEGMWESMSTENEHLQSEYLLSIEDAFSKARKHGKLMTSTLGVGHS